MYHLRITEDAKVKISSPVSQIGVSHYGDILSLPNTSDRAVGKLKVPHSVLKPYACNLLNIFIIIYITISLKKMGFIENFNWGSLYNAMCKKLSYLGHI